MQISTAKRLTFETARPKVDQLSNRQNSSYYDETKQRTDGRLTLGAHADGKAFLQPTVLATVAIMLRDWTLLVAST